MEILTKFISYTGFVQPEIWKNLIMIGVGLIFLYLAIAKDYEPLLLVPIGFGIILGNIPFALDAHLNIGIYEKGSVYNLLYFGVTRGIYPPLIFLGIGALTDFSALLSNPKLVLLGPLPRSGFF